MDYSTTISILIALLAVVISLVSLRRTSNFNHTQIKLQEETARLSRLQRDILERQENEKTRSDVAGSLYIAGTGHRIGILNIGNVEVRNVNVRVIAPAGKSSPLIEREVVEKLPVKRMHPGDEISLIAALSYDTGTTFDLHIEWETSDGKAHVRDQVLSI